MTFPGCYIRAEFLKVITLVLFIALSGIRCAAEPQEPGVRVEMNRINLSLHITLTTGAKTTAKVSRNRLPWEAGDSLMVIAARANGQCLERLVPVNDPMFDEIVMEPNVPLSGDVDLKKIFPDLRRLSELSDVQLFWAYEAPEALHISHWSGGWILIPKQK
jgi:hypothetical protein